jgi:hypothetical protein
MMSEVVQGLEIGGIITNNYEHMVSYGEEK